jgi:hypothetical protein
MSDYPQNTSDYPTVYSDADIGAIVLFENLSQRSGYADIQSIIRFSEVRLPEEVLLRESLLKGITRVAVAEIGLGAAFVASVDSNRLAEFLAGVLASD